MIRTILVDDQKDSLSVLKLLLEEYCPDVNILEMCQTSTEGIHAIIKQQPDLVFLDIEMPLVNGFDLLERVKQYKLAVIFTTAYHHYAIKAIRYSALDYLVKPINPKELVIAIQRYNQNNVNHAGTSSNNEQFQFLIDKLSKKDHTFNKIAIPNMEGFKLLYLDDIVYCEADDNYTHIYLKNKTRITASRILKDIQSLLEDYPAFVRIHHSYLINLNEVSQYIRGEGGQVIMNDGSQLSVSRNKKEALMKYMIKGD
jgi:two-component system, LytTR family, response regulator